MADISQREQAQEQLSEKLVKLNRVAVGSFALLLGQPALQQKPKSCRKFLHCLWTNCLLERQPEASALTCRKNY